MWLKGIMIKPEKVFKYFVQDCAMDVFFFSVAGLIFSNAISEWCQIYTLASSERLFIEASETSW